MEVVRDRADNAIIICSIENVDPMGVHTGDCITVAPALTLTDKEYQLMRSASIAVLREIGVETGGSNVQFAVDPKTGRMVVIEMNPRVSRSSALASKATGFPIAKVAARLAVGYTLDEIANDITGGATPASFEPTIDYVVTKIPRFAFEKFKGAEAAAVDLDEVGRRGDGDRPQLRREPAKGAARAGDRAERARPRARSSRAPIRRTIESALARATPDRLLVAAEALRQGFTVERINEIAGFDPWFLEAVARRSFEAEEEVRIRRACRATRAGMRRLKAMGFSDARLAELSLRSAHVERGMSEAVAAGGSGVVHSAMRGDDRRDHRGRGARAPRCGSASARCSSGSTAAPPSSRRRRPTCTRPTRRRCSASRRTRPRSRDRRKVMILGGGPNRIGQGIEFDYCCCHAAFALGRDGRGAASRRSWSIATRRRSRPTRTRRTGSISSR